MDESTLDGVTPRKVPGLVQREVDGELVVYDPSSTRTHALNRYAAAVYLACDGTSGLPRLVDRASEFAGEALTADHVLVALSDLEAEHLVESPVEGLSRRGLLGRVATGIVLVTAIPVIESVVAPSVAAAASGGGGGGGPLPTITTDVRANARDVGGPVQWDLHFTKLSTNTTVTSGYASFTSSSWALPYSYTGPITIGWDTGPPSVGMITITSTNGATFNLSITVTSGQFLATAANPYPRTGSFTSFSTFPPFANGVVSPNLIFGG